MNKLFTLATLSLGVISASADNVVYNNLVNYSGTFLNPGAAEVADEVILGSTNRTVSHFSFEYFGQNFSGNEQYRVRFYLNDGDFLGNNTYKPDTVFFDSGLQTLGTPLDISGRSTYDLDLSGSGLVLPERFTVSLQFTGIGSGETAGVGLYNPPTLGLSENDYWFNNGTTWELRGTNSPVNFGMSITAVPEPSTYVLAMLGGLCGFAVLRRRKK